MSVSTAKQASGIASASERPTSRTASIESAGPPGASRCRTCFGRQPIRCFRLWWR